MQQTYQKLRPKKIIFMVDSINEPSVLEQIHYDVVGITIILFVIQVLIRIVVASLDLCLVGDFHDIFACDLVYDESTELLADEVSDLEIVDACIVFKFEGAVLVFRNFLENPCIKFIVFFFVAMTII